MTNLEAVEQFNYNRSLGQDSEALAIAIWQSLFPRIQETASKMQGVYVAVVDDRSSLRLDDRYLGRWRTGSLHVTAMSAAMDALLAVQTILEPVISGEGALPMSALYPVMRAAIESASLAIYMLEPRLRDERLRRSFLVAAEDAKYHGSFADAMGKTNNGAMTAEAKAEIRLLIATRPTMGAPEEFQFDAVTYSGLVENAEAVIAADPAVPARDRMSLLAWWKLLSGFSHGKQWAFAEAMERSEAIVDEENQSAHLKMTSSAGAIAVCLERAVETLETALRLYGQRSKADWNQPEDALEPPTVPFSKLL
jgi:hypothetical protein